MSVKNNVRNSILSKRLSLSKQQVTIASNLICETIINANYLESGNIAFYKSIENEVELDIALTHAHQQRIQCYLPKLNLERSEITFHLYEQESSLTINTLNFYEPSNSHIILAKDLNVVFVPLVAFDDNSNRIGRGGGHYDKAFQFKSNHRGSTPLLIGIGYEFQKLDLIQEEMHDIPLDLVITEKDTYDFRI